MTRPQSRRSLLYLLGVAFFFLSSIPSAAQINPAPVLVWKEKIGLSRAPLFYDLTDDGCPELVIAALGTSRSKTISGLTCYQLSSPASRNWRFSSPTPDFGIWSIPAVADVNRDSLPELVISRLDGRISCLRGKDGRLVWEISGSGCLHSSPAVADVNADLALEIIVGSRDDHIYCFRARDGGLIWKFKTGGDVDSSAAIADVNGDGETEIVIGSDDFSVYCLAGRDGKLLWEYRTGWWVASSPIIADLEDDGTMEVLVGSNDGALYCLRGPDGTPLWRFQTSAPVVGEPIVGDLDSDGRLEIFFGSDSLYCLDAAGSQLWQFSPGEYFAITPLLVRDSQGFQLLATTENFYSLDAKSGALRWQRPFSDDVLYNPSASLNEAGELIICFSANSGNLSLFRSSDILSPASILWSKFRGDAENTGFAPNAFAFGQKLSSLGETP